MPLFFDFLQQEDPYKLVLVAKDIKQVCVTNAEFFFTEGELSIVTGDEDGILRVYEYNPQGNLNSYSYLTLDNDMRIDPDIDSNHGRYLLLRTEFQGQCEYRTSLLIARRKNEDQIPESKLLMGEGYFLRPF